MAGVNVKSEIKPLKKVLLHRPGKELLNLTPNTLEELLFDDIPFLKVAQADMMLLLRLFATTAWRSCIWRTSWPRCSMPIRLCVSSS